VDPRGHGLILSGTAVVAFVAVPLDVASLPEQKTRVGNHLYLRVPRGKILDVVALLTASPNTFCPHLVHSNFDRYPARMTSAGTWDPVSSVSRKVAYTRADGRKILQHTRTAASDFFRGTRTPGRLP
jgi:hypothetical protein